MAKLMRLKFLQLQNVPIINTPFVLPRIIAIWYAGNIAQCEYT